MAAATATATGRGGWLVGRFGGGCIGVVPSVRRQEGHSHTGRIRPHQSILRVQGHRPTNYPGLIDARRRRKKARSFGSSTSGYVCASGPAFSFGPRRKGSRSQSAINFSEIAGCGKIISSFYEV